MNFKQIPFKAFAVLLASSLFSTQCLWAHQLESSIWTERSRGMPRTLAPTVFKTSLSKQNIPNQTEELTGLISSLSKPFGSVRKISPPFGVRSDRVLVYIQDVHKNQEAQMNIAKTLQELLMGRGIDLVALEGAFTPLDLKAFRTFPHPDIVQKAADFLLRENMISGPVYAALTSSSEIPPIVGIDDEELHKENVDAYLASVPKIEFYKQHLLSLEKKLSSKKSREFNLTLMEFDARVQAYRKGTLNFAAYVQGLTMKDRPVPAMVQRFLKAREIETSLNLQQVEEERSRLLSALTTRLNPAQMANLTSAGVAFRQGRFSQADFYLFLQSLCRKNGVPLTRFPAMADFVAYVLLADGIDTDTLLAEVERLESDGFGSYAHTTEEKQLIKESTKLALERKLLNFALTRKEWDAYNEIARDSADDVTSFKTFYARANQRDNAMATKLLKEMDLRKARVAIIVAGGFHYDGIQKAANQAGVTVVSFVPRVTALESGSAYLSVFSQEKTPLEKLFEGDKLFLADEPFQYVNAISTILALHRRFHSDEPDPGIHERKFAADADGSVDAVKTGADQIEVELHKENLHQSVKVLLNPDGNPVSIENGFPQRNLINPLKWVPAFWSFLIPRLKARGWTDEQIARVGGIEDLINIGIIVNGLAACMALAGVNSLTQIVGGAFLGGLVYFLQHRNQILRLVPSMNGRSFINASPTNFDLARISLFGGLSSFGFLFLLHSRPFDVITAVLFLFSVSFFHSIYEVMIAPRMGWALAMATDQDDKSQKERSRSQRFEEDRHFVEQHKDVLVRLDNSNQADALRQYFLEGKSQTEIAAAEGLDHSSVSVRIREGIKELKRRVESGERGPLDVKRRKHFENKKIVQDHESLLVRLSNQLQAKALRLHFLEGKKQKDIALEEGLDHSTINIRIKEGLRELRQWIAELNDWRRSENLPAGFTLREVAYPEAALKGNEKTRAFILAVDDRYRLNVTEWPELDGEPFTIDEMERFKTKSEIIPLKYFNLPRQEIRSVKQSTYNRASGVIELRFVIKTHEGQTYFVEHVGPNTTDVMENMAPMMTTLSHLEISDAVAQVSKGNHADLHGYFTIKPDGQGGWKFSGASNEDRERKSFKVLIGHNDGQRELATVRLEEDSQTHRISQVFARSKGEVGNERILDPQNIEFVMAGYTLLWGDLREYYDETSDLRHLFRFPFIRGVPVFVDQVAGSSENMDRAFNWKPFEFRLQNHAKGPLQASELMSELEKKGYRERMSKLDVKERGDFFLGDRSIQIILLPARYPINGLAVSDDGKRLSFVAVQGKSGQIGANYWTFGEWLEQSLGWKPDAFFIFDNGMDPSWKIRRGNSLASTEVKGRDRVGSSMLVMRDRLLAREEITGLRKSAVEILQVAANKLEEVVGQFGHNENIPTELKKDRSVVSVADREIRQAVLHEIRSRYPNDEFFSEESSELSPQDESSPSGRVWTLDEIDGTAPFLRGEPFYAIPLSLHQNGKPVLAVVWLPEIGILTASEDREGVYLQDAYQERRLESLPDESKTVSSLRMTIAGESLETELLKAQGRNAQDVEWKGSSVFTAAQIALGHLDFYSLVTNFEQCHLWDIAAISYILEKAGARLSVLEDGQLKPAQERIAVDITDPNRRSRAEYQVIAANKQAMHHMQTTFDQIKEGRVKDVSAIVRPFKHDDQLVYRIGLGALSTGRIWKSHKEIPTEEQVMKLYVSVVSVLNRQDVLIPVDLAPAYGLAEERFGKFLSHYPQFKDRFFVSTKWGEDFDPATNQSVVDHSIENLKKSFHRSRSLIGDKTPIQALYIHKADRNVLSQQDLITEMQAMKDRGDIRYIGASISNGDEIQKCLDAGLITADKIDVLMMPANVFLDPNRKTMVETLKHAGIAIVLSYTEQEAKSGFPNLTHNDHKNNFVVALTGTINHFGENVLSFLTTSLYSFVLVVCFLILSHSKVQATVNKPAGTPQSQLIGSIIGTPQLLDVSSIAGPAKFAAQSVREKKETVILADESMARMISSEFLANLMGLRTDSYASLTFVARTPRIAGVIQDRLILAMEDSPNSSIRVHVEVQPSLFSTDSDNPNYDIEVDRLVRFLAEQRKVKPIYALSDLCLIASPHARFHTRDASQQALIENLVSVGQLVVIGLNQSVVTALRTMIST